MFGSGKFNPTAILKVETAPDARGESTNITIPDHCTIEFAISRQSLSSSQRGTFNIKGLAPEERDAIFKDRFNTADVRAIQFYAGYGTFAPLIFNGQVFQAYSEKPEGAPEVTTSIDAFDGGFQQTNGFTSGWGVPNQAIPPGTSAADVINQLGASLPYISGPPIVGSFPQENLRHEVLFGNTWSLIQAKCGGVAVIDNATVKALNLNEAIDMAIPLINSDTGLLGSPRRSGYLVEWDTLFEPRLTLFQLVEIQSLVNPKFNGTFKVMGFTHRGTISPAVAGDNRTTFSVLFGTQGLSLVSP
jgi:hypothetical protein